MTVFVHDDPMGSFTKFCLDSTDVEEGAKKNFFEARKKTKTEISLSNMATSALVKIDRTSLNLIKKRLI